MLDDAINNAKGAGFTTDVRTRTEKVSSQAEADRLNQEEALRVQALAKRVQSQVESAKSSDQSLKQVVTTALTDQTKVSAESDGQNQTITKEKPSAPVDPATVASIEPVKWVAKYTKPYTEKPPVPKENPVEPPVLPEPKKPEEKPLPTPPKKEELPKRPDLKAIASGSNSFVVRSRKAVRPSIAVERVQYVAEGRVSSANSLVVRTRNDVKRAGSGNSFIIRRM